METRFARRSAAARLIHVNTVSRFLAQTLHTASHLARPTPALKFIAALAAVGLFAGIPANALITPTAPVGATPGSFAVSPSGAATYTIPIVVAPGTNGMQPNLSLVYNSQGGNGLLGMGWSLAGLSVIHRCGATIEIDGFKGGVNYDANDRFCLDGERLIQIGPTEFRTEHESFQRVFIGGPLSDPAWFSVWDKDGGDRGYGVAPDSRIQALGRSMARIWAISYVRDKSLNRMNFSYEINNDGDYRPSSISYSTNTVAGTSTPSSSVTFTYGPRSDVTWFPDAGANTKRLLAISTSSNDTVVRRYNFSYQYGVSTMRSRLSSITECGTDNVCLTPTQFQWQEGGSGGEPPTSMSSGFNGGPGYNNDGTRAYVDVDGDGKTDFCRLEGPDGSGSYNINCFLSLDGSTPARSAVSSGFNSGPGYDNPGTRAYVDVNGDGKADFCRLEGPNGSGSYNINCFMSLDGTAPAVSSVTTGFNSGPGYNNQGTRAYVDVNGDGKADFCRLEGPDGTGSYYITCTTNLGTGGSAQEVTTFGFNGGPGYNNQGTRAYVDVNGDGKADFCRLEGPTSAGSYYIICTTNLGSGGPAQDIITTGFNSGPGYNNDGTRAFVDINGDGKADFCRLEGPDGTGSYYITCTTNLGTGGSAQEVTTFGFNGGPGYNNQGTRAYVDVNGDGRADFCRLEGNYYINCTINLGSGGPAQSVNATGFNGGPGFDNAGTRAYVDVNGDGKADFCRLEGGPGNYYILCSQLDGNSAPPDLLKTITTGLGAVISISHKPLTDNTVYTKDTSSAYPYQDVQAAIYVVSRSSTTNGVGGYNTVDYLYGGLKRHHRADRSLGFRWMKTTDNASGIITNTSFIQSYDGTEGQPFYAYTVAGGKVVKLEEKSWIVSGAGFPRWPRLDSSRDTTYEPNLPTGSDVVTRVTTNVTYDSYAFPLTTIVDFGDGWRKTISNTYNHDTTNWRLGQITQAQVTAEAPGIAPKTRTSVFTYNSGGLLASETIEPSNPALALTTTYAYDAFGNRTSKTVSGAGIVTRTDSQGYDATGSSVVSSTNALGQASIFGYDPRGLLTSQTDPNGLLTRWDYDGFGRKGKEIRPDGTQTTIAYEARATGYAVSTFTPGAANTYTDYDILGRPIRNATVGFGGPSSTLRWIFKATQYDSLGRIARVSNPYFENETRYDTTYTYDDVSRVKTITTPGVGTHTTITNYSGLTTTVTNPRGHVTTTVKNSQGKVVSVTDSAGTTSYVYDPFLNLTQVTDAAGNVTTMSYDIRGRKTAMHDPDMGNWSYSYDVLSELKTQTDAKGQLISMNYDKLGRMTSRTTPEGTSTWTYDTATYGIGKLANVSGPGGYQESYAYDPLSRPSSTTTAIAGTNYTVATTYDTFGRLDAITYPITGYKVKQVYDPYGFLYQVLRVKLDNTQSLLWQADAADAFSHVTREIFWNGVSSQRVYDPATVDLLSIQTGSGGANTQNVQNLTYGWDELHNLSFRNDAITGVNETFGYDAVSRLTQASWTAPAGNLTKTYQYNAIGNITNKSDVGAYTYNASGASSIRPHAVTQTSGEENATYTYDANGNMMTGGGRTLTYTSFNKPQTITGANGTTSFSYDSNYNRIQKVTSTQTTAYVGKLYEKVTSGTLIEHKHYIYGGRSLVAIYTERNNAINDIDFVHTDHLDSINVITYDSGVEKERLSFDPFGRRRQTEGPDWNGFYDSSVTRGFTRHEHDEEANLINMNARLYDPMLGRFITSDTVVDGIAGQGLNRYSYVRNNPLSLTDPTGNWSLKKTLARVTSSIVSAVSGVNYVGGMMRTAVLTNLSFGAAYGWSTGDWKSVGQAHKNGTIMTAQAFAFNWAGAEFAGNVPGRIIAHGMIGGAFSEINGGSFRSGFFSGIAGAASGIGCTALACSATAGFIVSSMAGGIGSRLGGGSFSDGAVTSAMGYLFNELPHRAGRGQGTSYYDVDAIRLENPGDSVENSAGKLRVNLGDGEYSARIRIENVDRSLTGEILGLHESRVSVQFNATLLTADGTFTSSFEISRVIPPGGYSDFPAWSNFSIRGPGSIEMGIRNTGPFDIGVVFGVVPR